MKRRRRCGEEEEGTRQTSSPLEKYGAQPSLAHFTLRLSPGRMSFTNKPAYVPWKPNQDFIKFFEDMKKRRISATDNPTMKVTDTPMSSSLRQQKSDFQPLKINYSTISETLVNTARGEMKLRKGNKKTVKKAPKIKRIRAGKGNVSLESKIKNHQF